MSQFDIFSLLEQAAVPFPEPHAIQFADQANGQPVDYTELQAYKEATPIQRKLVELLAKHMSWAMSHTMTMSKTSGMNGEEMEYLANKHKGAVEWERWLRVLKFWKQRPDENDAEAVKEFMSQGKDLMQRLTDREVCLILSDLSSIGPPDDESFAEYMRGFATSFGLDYFLQIQGTWLEPLNAPRCEQSRYNYPKARETFPLVDRGWIEQFNKEAQVAWEAQKTLPSESVVSEEQPVEMDLAAIMADAGLA